MKANYDTGSNVSDIMFTFFVVSIGLYFFVANIVNEVGEQNFINSIINVGLVIVFFIALSFGIGFLIKNSITDSDNSNAVPIFLIENISIHNKRVKNISSENMTPFMRERPKQKHADANIIIHFLFASPS